VTGGALSPNTDNNEEESSWTSLSEPFSFSFLVLHIPLVPHERDVGENDRALQMWLTGKWMGAAWALFFLFVVWIWISLQSQSWEVRETMSLGYPKLLVI
jgi:hypothetical protein